MIQKGAAALVVLALFTLSYPAVGQTTQPAQSRPNSSSSSAPLTGNAGSQSKTSNAVPPRTQGSAPANQLSPNSNSTNVAPSTGREDCVGANCDLPQPRISISTPAPAPAPWPWQQRISWAAELLLVAMGYVGIILALGLLRRIERQGKYVEEAAQAASESARAALMHVDAIARAERPWVLMSVRPANNDVNGFTVTATNRGRGPARILSTVDDTVCTIDDNHLDPVPTFRREPAAPPEPIILLPSETIELLSFSRSDAQNVCENDEQRRRVESWEEKIYLYGKVMYQDLTAPDDAPPYESSWLCWYIHGRQKSGMVMAGPPAYNRHT